MDINKRPFDSLHPSQKEIDALWAKEAEKRVEEIRTGKVMTISCEEVFREIRKKYSTANL